MPRPHAYTIGQQLLWNTAWGKPLPVTVTRLDGWSPQGEPEYLVRSERFDTEWSLGESVIHTLPVETPELAPLLGLVGRKQVGKDFAADELALGYGFVRLAFADLLKDLALDINPLVNHLGLRLVDAVDHAGWEWAKQFPEGRQFIQRLGDRARMRLGRDTWITPVITKANELRQQGVPVVISDVRYANEAEAVKAAGGTLIKIIRPSLEITDNHPSEAESDSIETDYEITNDTELGDLSTVVDLLADHLNLGVAT